MKITQVLKILVIILLISAPTKVNASCIQCNLICPAEDTIRLQRLARNITTSFTYEETFDEEGFGRVRFTVKLSNMHNDLVIWNSRVQDYPRRFNTSSNEIIIRNETPGTKTYRIYGNRRNCNNFVHEIYVMIPHYNRFYKQEPCDKIPEFSLCRKWTNVTGISFEDFQRRTQEFMNVVETPPEIDSEVEETWFDKLMDFISKYRYYIGAGMIAITIIIIVITNNIKKKNEFDLNTN